MSGNIGSGCVGMCKYKFTQINGIFDWYREDPTIFKCGPDTDCQCTKPNVVGLDVAQPGNILYTDCRIPPAIKAGCDGNCGYKCVSDGHGGWKWEQLDNGCFGNPYPYDACICKIPNVVPGSGAALSGVRVIVKCQAVNFI